MEINVVVADCSAGTEKSAVGGTYAAREAVGGGRLLAMIEISVAPVMVVLKQL